jgi:hypothetical protein
VSPPSAVVAKKKKSYVSVKIEADVYRDVKTVAAWKGLKVAEYLSEIARAPARRDLDKIHGSRPPRQDGGGQEEEGRHGRDEKSPAPAVGGPGAGLSE